MSVVAITSVSQFDEQAAQVNTSAFFTLSGMTVQGCCRALLGRLGTSMRTSQQYYGRAGIHSPLCQVLHGFARVHIDITYSLQVLAEELAEISEKYDITAVPTVVLLKA